MAVDRREVWQADVQNFSSGVALLLHCSCYFSQFQPTLQREKMLHNLLYGPALPFQHVPRCTKPVAAPHCPPVATPRGTPMAAPCCIKSVIALHCPPVAALHIALYSRCHTSQPSHSSAMPHCAYLRSSLPSCGCSIFCTPAVAPHCLLVPASTSFPVPVPTLLYSHLDQIHLPHFHFLNIYLSIWSFPALLIHL